MAGASIDKLWTIGQDSWMDGTMKNGRYHLRKLKMIHMVGAVSPEIPQGGRRLHWQSVDYWTGFLDGLDNEEWNGPSEKAQDDPHGWSCLT